MPVKIRLMRIGAKKRPFYRVVAVDERAKRNGEYLELLGTYNPLTNPKEILLKKDRIEEWTKKGAVLSHGYMRIVGLAPQKPPRKAKKTLAAKQPESEKPTSAPVESETQVAVTNEPPVAETPTLVQPEPTEQVAPELTAPAEEQSAASNTEQLSSEAKPESPETVVDQTEPAEPAATTEEAGETK